MMPHREPRGNHPSEPCAGFWAEKSSAITSRFQSAFGLDEFLVQAGNDATSSSLLAGKRVSPRRSIGADFNSFDRLWTLFRNYKLSETLSVEAESGESQDADLLYARERRQSFYTEENR